MSLAGLLGVVLLASLALSPVLQDPAPMPDLSTSYLAEGPYARMHMLLEKTIFRLDVLTAEMRFGAGTREKLERVAAGREYSEQLAGEVTAAALEADHAIVTVEFERDVGLHRWIDGVRSGVWLAAKSGLITQETSDQVSGDLPRWFAPVAARGFEKGDRIIYRIYPDRVRTLVVSDDGRVFVDHVDKGASNGRTVLAGFMAPGTEFRKPLVKSLLQR
jgi:hypothetical protein